MSYKHVNKRVLSTNEPFLVLSPATVKIVGRSAAIVLQQLHYWISSPAQYGQEKDGRRWIYNTYEEWHKQIKVFSTKTIQRAFKTLVDLEIVLSERINKKASDQTLSYTIVYEKLAQLLNIEEFETHQTEDKMTKSSGQNDPIFIKNTNKTTEKTFLSENSEKIEIFDLDRNKKKINISDEMLCIWNNIIETNNSVISLNTHRSRFLNKAYTDFFQSDINQWKAYCHKIASSKFLMGEVKDFKASIDWCLKFDIIQKIMEGQYSQGTRQVRSEKCEQDINSKPTLISMPEDNESPDAISVRNNIQLKIGNDLYISWFADSRIIIEQGRGTLFVGSDFKKDRIKNQFRDILEDLNLDVNFCENFQDLKEKCKDEFCENKEEEHLINNDKKPINLICEENIIESEINPPITSSGVSIESTLVAPQAAENSTHSELKPDELLYPTIFDETKATSGIEAENIIKKSNVKNIDSIPFEVDKKITENLKGHHQELFTPKISTLKRSLLTQPYIFNVNSIKNINRKLNDSKFLERRKSSYFKNFIFNKNSPREMQCVFG